MAKNKVIYNNETLIDLTDTTAEASDVAIGKYFYTSAGVKTQGTNSGGGGDSGLTLLKTTSLGALATSSTSAQNTGKTITITDYNDYDLLVVDVSVDTNTNNRHTSTVSLVLVTGIMNVATKGSYAVCSNKWNSKLDSTGTGSTRQSTVAYGVYVNSVVLSDGTMTLTFYSRYHSLQTSTIDGEYTARVYGVKLYDLIGG